MVVDTCHNPFFNPNIFALFHNFFFLLTTAYVRVVLVHFCYQKSRLSSFFTISTVMLWPVVLFLPLADRKKTGSAFFSLFLIP